MKHLFQLLTILVFSAQAQMNISDPISLTGHVNGIRTVHFTPDNKFIYGDFQDLVKWNLEDKNIVATIPIPGYNVHKSLMNESATIWAQGNVNYNSPKNDIGDTHLNLNIWKGDKMVSKKMDNAFSVGAFIPRTNDIIICYYGKDFKNNVMRYNLDNHTSTTNYFSETNSFKGVPAAIDVSPNGKIMAISMCEGNRGVYFYDVNSGSLLGKVSMEADAYGGKFGSQGNKFYVVSGKKLIIIDVVSRKINKEILLDSEMVDLDISSSGKFAICRGIMSGVYLVDVDKGTVQATLFKNRVFDLKFSPGDKYIALGVQKSFMDARVPSIILFKNLDYREPLTAVDDNPGISGDSGGTVTIDDDNPGIGKEEVSIDDVNPGIVGEKSRDNWNTNKYSQGGFQIDLPGTPEVKLPEPGEKGQYQMSGEYRKEPLFCIFTSHELTKSGLSVKEKKRLLKKIAKTYSRTVKASRVSSRFINNNDNMGYEEVLAGNGARYHCYYFVTDTRIIKISVVHTKGKDTPEEQRILDSLQIY